jgi:hypothetical protein
MNEARASCEDARKILEPLWRQNPELHGNWLARINLVAADIAGAEQAEQACAFARQALAVAYDPALKHDAQQLIDQFCPPANHQPPIPNPQSPTAPRS